MHFHDASLFIHVLNLTFFNYNLHYIICCFVGWHHKINKDIGKANAAFYILVPALQRESKLVDLQVRLVSEEQVIRNQRSRTLETEGKLSNLWFQYTEEQISASQLLKGCAGIYGPAHD